VPADQSYDLKFEIGHVLFIDIVGYSKLLINEQSEQIQTLKEIVRGTEQFGWRKQKANCSGCQPATAARWFSGPVQKRRSAARLKSPTRCKNIRGQKKSRSCGCEWEFTAAR
jgi:hypothetical protein